MIRKAVIVVLTLAALATGVAWVVAPDPRERHLRNPGTGTTPRVQVVAGNGGPERCLIIGYGVFLRDEPPGVADIYVKARRQLLGVSYNRYESLPNPPVFVDGWAVAVPFWLLIVLLSAYPMSSFVRGPARKWRRRKRALCVRCGYNLTGLTEPRCPECRRTI